MRTDSEIKILGFEILNHHLGIVETEKICRSHSKREI